MQTSNEASVKIKIVCVGLASRLLILASAAFLYNKGGFLNSTFKQFMYILLPVSIMYIAFFLKFIVKNLYGYPFAAKRVNKGYVGLGYYALWILNLAEFLVIIYKAESFATFPEMPIQDFFLYVSAIEITFGVMAGLYISELFSNNKQS
ncbi:hypothetical protein [Mucilaginibacter paludis]|uniref:Transmembrane protein n=1 Tax=Mucilaginibacter paludis DSM 18603 TaxID=714943 RepID=H1YC01_9SPHI|nr:hypothetical protein [Mucilaginibacter paludis]EHQ27079.1 hypothetical protein Mucpa_2971 [Mucilaginibacter paludis DSM 18603]